MRSVPSRGSRSSRSRAGQKLAGHDRILSAAYKLFVRRGVRAVGIDEIISSANVAKATFYRHFRSKDELILAFLHRREHVWTRGLLEAEVLRRAATPRLRLLAIFDVLDDWFHTRDFEGCPFIASVAQAVEPQDRVRREAVAQLAVIRSFVRRLATEGGVPEPARFAASWQTLMAGSIVMALSGDRLAARRARRTGQLLLSASAAA
ncbi:MAG TPA: helix-turn-helix domain-containing protein [Candidatus Limnocylindrales bacterium]|nr:helix-turn-helix domain-containing protein [Candidatus Limnocylindrales bacterium]